MAISFLARLRKKTAPTVIFILLFPFNLLISLEYTAKIKGTVPEEIKKEIYKRIDTFTLQKKPPDTLLGIKRRAKNDIEKIIRVAHYYGFYNATVSTNIVEGTSPEVVFTINLGNPFLLKAFYLLPAHLQDTPIETIDPTLLRKHYNALNLPFFTHLKKGPITTLELIESETTLIDHLKSLGFADAKVIEKKFLVNSSKQSITVIFYINEGNIMYFGPTTIEGKTKVTEESIRKRILWKEGDRFDPDKITKTTNYLEKSGLFSSVSIEKNQNDALSSEIPLTLHLHDAKHHTIGAGISYTTSLGPGITAEWENRNFRKKGEHLSVQTQLWNDFRTAIVNYTIPEIEPQKDLVWLFQWEKQENIAFSSTGESLSQLFMYHPGNGREFSWGTRIENLETHDVFRRKRFWLFRTPVQFQWNAVDNILDPARGVTLNIRLKPTIQFLPPSFAYTTHTSSLTGYYSFFSDSITLASKITFGNIMGAKQRTIPAPDRFYGGSENSLRGYRSGTVSPLKHHHKPIGGRSILTGSLEARFRSESGIGFVTFYDVGIVSRTHLPHFEKNKFHSFGFGMRYETPIGPLRLDIAFPLNKRKIDPSYQIYFSIGQSF